jgi:hypothetical protein
VGGVSIELGARWGHVLANCEWPDTGSHNPQPHGRELNFIASFDFLIEHNGMKLENKESYKSFTKTQEFQVYLKDKCLFMNFNYSLLWARITPLPTCIDIVSAYSFFLKGVAK